MTKAAVTQLLSELESGDRSALDELFDLLYRELTDIAGRQRRRWQGNYTLNTTALVHEAYVRLVDKSRLGVESRGHFLALASKVMRHVLCDYARERGARKRGGDLDRLSLHEIMPAAGAVVFTEAESERVVSLDAALRKLESVDERKSKVVECRFFGGLSVEETAEALGVSTRTVKRDWAVAQAWLQRETSAPP